MSKTILLDKQFFIKSLAGMAQLAEEQRDHWTELDSTIGDGDHGINLTIGFRGIIQNFPTITQESNDINTLFKKAGMILLSKVGGASGPLYGSFFLKFGKDFVDKSEVNFIEFLQMIKSGIIAIQERGKAQKGDKTMMDAFYPALELIDAYNGEDSLDYFCKIISAMKQGSDSTIPITSKLGRSSRLGARAIGHRDAGSESAWMLMNVFKDQLAEIFK